MPLRLLGALALVFLMAVPAEAQTCKASWYGGKERLNRHTANGEVFKRNGNTVAHRSLKFGTKVPVCRGARCVVVRINDRGPHKSAGAASILRGVPRQRSV